MPSPTTFVRTVRELENWPEAVALRFRIGRRALSFLSFRNGITVGVRRQSRDWDVVRDLFLQSGYVRSFDYLRTGRGGEVLDLGANIGCFSLLAAAQNEKVSIQAYEPGPPNIRMFELNCLANPGLAGRIALHEEAAGGRTRSTRWHFDPENAGGSSLFGTGAGDTLVRVSSFADIVSRAPGAIALAKIDIEGAEYELVRATPPEVWTRIPAVSIEVHRDPEGIDRKQDLLARLEGLGFKSEPDGHFARFLYR